MRRIFRETKENEDKFRQIFAEKLAIAEKNGMKKPTYGSGISSFGDNSNKSGTSSSS